ncbi:MAG: hypothetical protein WAZ18_03205 [Alphaproteobacteria bacterium]
MKKPANTLNDINFASIQDNASLLRAAEQLVASISSQYPIIEEGCGTDVFMDQLTTRVSTLKKFLNRAKVKMTEPSVDDPVPTGHFFISTCLTPWNGKSLYFTAQGLFAERPVETNYDDNMEDEIKLPDLDSSELDEELPF